MLNPQLFMIKKSSFLDIKTINCLFNWFFFNYKIIFLVMIRFLISWCYNCHFSWVCKWGRIILDCIFFKITRDCLSDVYCSSLTSKSFITFPSFYFNDFKNKVRLLFFRISKYSILNLKFYNILIAIILMSI
jgi:hypothetical protein